MDAQPAEVINSIDDKNLIANSNGEPEIKEDSKLAKYIVYCGQRSSPWGVADQNIASEVDTAGSVGGTVGSSIIGAIPIVGDGFDIVSNEQKYENMGWISGESCVVGNDNGDGKYDSSIGWKEAKKYQRFIEDQRLAEAEGIIEESAVTKYLASYYEKHPLDNSFEGVLARNSGYTKETVEDVLAILELSTWLADYDPSTYAPYVKNELHKEETKNISAIEDESIRWPAIFAAVTEKHHFGRRIVNIAAI
jgi:hypothetical protein